MPFSGKQSLQILCWCCRVKRYSALYCHPCGLNWIVVLGTKTGLKIHLKPKAKEHAPSTVKRIGPTSKIQPSFLFFFSFCCSISIHILVHIINVSNSNYTDNEHLEILRQELVLDTCDTCNVRETSRCIFSTSPLTFCVFLFTRQTVGEDESFRLIHSSVYQLYLYCMVITLLPPQRRRHNLSQFC